MANATPMHTIGADQEVALALVPIRQMRDDRLVGRGLDPRPAGPLFELTAMPFMPSPSSKCLR